MTVWESRQPIEDTVSRALLTAHLLTANIEQAENAVMEAMDSFDPERDSEEVLFRNTLYAAVRGPGGDPLSLHPKQAESSGWLLPAELHAILNLPENLRRCFVLRVLVGLSRQAAAQLLRLNTRGVDRYTCAALQRLAGGAGV